METIIFNLMTFSVDVLHKKQETLNSVNMHTENALFNKLTVLHVLVKIFKAHFGIFEIFVKTVLKKLTLK